jgi:hypothetical protein
MTPPSAALTRIIDLLLANIPRWQSAASGTIIG